MKMFPSLRHRLPIRAVVQMAKPRGTHHRKGNEEIVITLGGGNLKGMGNGGYGYLAKTIQEELMNVGVAVNDEMQAVFDEIGKEAAKMLREQSPVNHRSKKPGYYAKGWVYEKGKRTYNFKCYGVVRNKNAPQLTHLLEYGHPLVRNGKVVGNVDAKPHIREVAEWCADVLDNELIKTLGGK